MEHSIYQPQERFLYKYFNGEKVTAVDPLAMFKKFLDIQGDLLGAIAVARSEMKDARKEDDKAVKMCREFFGVKPWDPETQTGLTELESLNLMDHFIDFCESVKKNSNPTQTSPEETSDTTPLYSEESPPITNTSDSGSTESDKPTEPPGSLPEEQQSPSA